MRRRKTEQQRSPRITHDQVIELLVDYHLGRLDPRINREIELHVAGCPLCQIQGLVHTGTEKRAIQRRISKAKPTRRRISRRVRIILLILVIIIVALLAVYALLRTNLVVPPTGASAEPFLLRGISAMIQ
ncbi:MAG: zf-HC2 domain-containing protein [Ktedonobacterales bacterium]